MMDEDYRYVFSTLLHAELKKRIVGRIFTKITYYDELLVKIDTYDDLTYTVTIPNISDKILNGYTTEYAMYEVMKNYRDYIQKLVNKKYFY